VDRGDHRIQVGSFRAGRIGRLRQIAADDGNPVFRSAGGPGRIPDDNVVSADAVDHSGRRLVD